MKGLLSPWSIKAGFYPDNSNIKVTYRSKRHDFTTSRFVI